MELYEDHQLPYIVLYNRHDIMANDDPPFAFKCMADDSEHAEEQCLNADPDADIVFVEQTDNVEYVYYGYYYRQENGWRQVDNLY